MKKNKRNSKWLRSIVLIFSIPFLILLGLMQPHASQDVVQKNINHYRAASKERTTSQNFFQKATFQTAPNSPYFQRASQTPPGQLKVGSPHQNQRTKNMERPYKQNEVLVKFKPTTGQMRASTAMNTLQMQPVKHFRMVDVHLTRTPPGKSVAETVRQLKNNPLVEYAEPNYIWYADEIIPDDQDFRLLWGLNNTGQSGGTVDADIDAPEAWDLQTGSCDVVVAVIDTGVDYTHVDLAGNIWTFEGEIAGDSIDNDGNGYVDDVHGINSINGSGDPMDDNGHGTHCAGTIAGVGNNGTGVTGVSWSSKIMALKFLNEYGSGNTNNAIECIEYMIDMKNTYGVNVKVSSNSWGGGGYSIALEDAINLARDNDIIIIAAAGNSSANNDFLPHYPASYNCLNIVSVAASDHNDELASFSCYGYNTVDVAAPGVSIWSTIPGDSYQYKGGTSMATPHVAGLAALIYSHYPGISHLEVKERLLRTVDTKSHFTDTLVSGGRINAHAALTANFQGPLIYSLSPWATSHGVEITIEGSQFGDNQGAGLVTFFDNLTASIVSWSDHHITCIVPSGCQSGPVTVTTNSGAQSNEKLFALAGSFSGYITDELSGNPLDWIRVLVFDSDLNFLSYVLSDEEGYYVLGGLPTGDYYVRTENNQGYIDKRYADADPDEGDPPPVHVEAPNNTPNIDFALVLGGSISGQITHDPTGEPLPDILISFFDSNGDYLPYQYTWSDSQGHYTINKLSAGDYYVGTTSAQNYIDKFYADVNPYEGDPPPVHIELATMTPNIDFALATGGIIRGIITDCEEPSLTIEGVGVFAQEVGGDAAEIGFSNSDGSYEILGLPTASYEVSAIQYDGIYIQKRLESPIEVIAEDVYNLDFCMEVGGTISGSIDCKGCVGGAIMVKVLDKPVSEDGNIFNLILIPGPGPYSLGGLPYDTEMWVYADWSTEFFGTPEYTGSYEENPITLIKGGPYPTDIDIHIDKPCDSDADCDGICNPGESAPNCSGSDECPYDPENDIDDDGICGDIDNCPHHSNPTQEDTFPPQGNSIGDACECEGDFDCDGDADGTDATTFKLYFGRNSLFYPCDEINPCRGDFDCDQDCDGTDAVLFKSDFGRSMFYNSCPACTVGDWCFNSEEPPPSTTTTIPPTTTTVPATSTTTSVQSECLVNIMPSSATVYTWETVQFSTTQNGDCNAPCYDWDVVGSSGGTIDNAGLYTAGGNPGIDMVEVTDSCNENAYDSAMVNVTSLTTTVPPTTTTTAP